MNTRVCRDENPSEGWSWELYNTGNEALSRFKKKGARGIGPACLHVFFFFQDSESFASCFSLVFSGFCLQSPIWYRVVGLFAVRKTQEQECFGEKHSISALCLLPELQDEIPTAADWLPPLHPLTITYQHCLLSWNTPVRFGPNSVANVEVD